MVTVAGCCRRCAARRSTVTRRRSALPELQSDDAVVHVDVEPQIVGWRAGRRQGPGLCHRFCGRLAITVEQLAEPAQELLPRARSRSKSGSGRELRLSSSRPSGNSCFLSRTSPSSSVNRQAHGESGCDAGERGALIRQCPRRIELAAPYRDRRLVEDALVALLGSLRAAAHREQQQGCNEVDCSQDRSNAGLKGPRYFALCPLPYVSPPTRRCLRRRSSSAASAPGSTNPAVALSGVGGSRRCKSHRSRCRRSPGS